MPQGTIINIVPFRNSAEPIVVDKASFLTSIDKAFFGQFRDEVNIINPVVNVQYDGVIDFNYVFISELDRFYFVTDVVYVTTELIELHLDIDVLMTYKDLILQQEAFVIRNENTFDPLIIDTALAVEVGVDTEVIEGSFPVASDNPVTRYVITGCIQTEEE